MAAVHPQNQHTPVFDDPLYRLIAETIPHMVWAARPDGVTDYHNRRVEEYTGLSAAQLEGWGWKAMVHAEDWERCRERWTRALQTGERYELEYRLRRADGAYRWHHANAMALRDAAGRIVRWFGTATDIDDQVRGAQLLERKVEERTRELRETQTRLRALIETEPECVKLLDSGGVLLEMNAAGLRMIEADGAEQVVGQCVYPIVAPEHRDAFRDLTERVCRGERGSLEFELIGLKGTRRWMEMRAAPFLDEARGEMRLLAITRDITDRRCAEQALRESERRFQLFMDNAPAVAWIKDARFRYAYVNRSYERLFGRPASEVLGREDFELHAAPLAAFFRDDDEKILRAGAASQKLHEVPHADGKLGHWLVVKFPLGDAAGGTGVAGIAIDATPRLVAEEKARRYAEDVRRLMDRLVGAQEAERRRVADDLHDLIGQNLSALGIDLQALKQRLQASGDTLAGPRLDAMATLVETTIDAIRGVMGELRPAALEEFGLVPALRWQASIFAKRTGMKVSTSVEGRELRLAPDTELALFRVVQEALTNAAKHSGGRAVEIVLHMQKSGLRLTIADDGRGFEDPALARGAPRGGFGLPSMRERIEARGGTLRIEQPGRGARLVIEVPAPGHAD